MKLSEETKSKHKHYEYNCYFPNTYKELKYLLPKIERLEKEKEDK